MGFQYGPSSVLIGPNEELKWPTSRTGTATMALSTCKRRLESSCEYPPRRTEIIGGGDD